MSIPPPDRTDQLFVHANGIDIAYTDVGDGPPLVLLHGAYMSSSAAWFGSGYSFVDHVPEMARHFRLISPDTRGSGASVHSGASVRFDVLAADLVAFVDALKLDKPMVGGFSEGGATATVAVLSHPDRFRALVNHAGFDYFYQTPDTMEDFRSAFGGAPDATAADPDYLEERYRSDYQMMDFFDRLQADYDGAQGPGYWRQYIHQLFDRTLNGVAMTRDALAPITIPTLVLAGDQDFFCSPEMTTEIHRTIPGSELGIIPGMGHQINRLLVDVIIDFLLRVEAD